MGVNHILGWYYGKLSWNRMWSHSTFLVNRFAAGPRKQTLLASSKVGFKVRDYKNGKEVKRIEVNSLAAALPTIEIDKDVSM